MGDLSDSAFVSLMRVLPKSTISHLVGGLTRLPAPAIVHQTAIRAFIKVYGVAEDEFEGTVRDYRTFDAFFSRPLKASMRTFDQASDAVCSPVDGQVAQLGTLDGEMCLQAKGIQFPIAKLLGDAGYAARFSNGAYITLYLAPRDYHRFHAPVAGEVLATRSIPGKFWPVNPATAKSVDALYAVNERLVIQLRTRAGALAFVAVGATCVARIRTTFSAGRTHQGKTPSQTSFDPPVRLEMGGELGAFEMGSTVILLFEGSQVRWLPTLRAGTKVRAGERIGSLR